MMLSSCASNKLPQLQYYWKALLEMYSDWGWHLYTNASEMTPFGDLILEHLCVPQPGQKSKQTDRENMGTWLQAAAESGEEK